MQDKPLLRKLIGSEDERAVSPVIGVILMVAITVILAAVIAAFVLDIGPGDTDPNAAIEISDEEASSVTVQLQSTDDNTDGVAIIADSDDRSDADEGDVVEVLTTSGEQVTLDEDDDEAADYEVQAFSGEPGTVENVGDDGEDDVSDDISDEVTGQAIIGEFTVTED